VHYPAGVTLAPGTVLRQPGYITDLMPTCVEVADAEYPTERAGREILPAEGASLMPWLTGGDRPARPILVEHEASKAIRDGDWKLVQERGGHPWELYNLALDPTEMHDRAQEEPGRVEAMRAAWDAWARGCGLEPVAPRFLR
jgi:arylsulfatase